MNQVPTNTYRYFYILEWNVKETKEEKIFISCAPTALKLVVDRNPYSGHPVESREILCINANIQYYTQLNVMFMD